MDLEDQGRLKSLVERHGTEGVVVLLGANSPDSVRLVAQTVYEGDPAYAGPLAGVSLKLPAYHILEPEIRAQVSPEVRERELALVEMITDVQAVTAPLVAYREERRPAANGHEEDR